MSIKIVEKLKNDIYELLSNNEVIKSNTNGIYFTSQGEIGYPFIFVNILQVQDSCNSVFSSFKFNFAINILHENEQDIIEILNQVTETLSITNFKTSGYKLISLDKSKIFWTQDQNLFIAKTSIEYSGFMRAYGEFPRY